MLIKSLSLRSNVYNTALVLYFICNAFYRTIYRFCLHKHTGASTICIIVNFVVLIVCKISYINCV